MGLKEIIASKKLRTELNNLYHRINDSYVDLTARVDELKLLKPAAVGMLEVVCESGKEDYAKLKAANSNLQEVLIESDKKFNSLFYSIDGTIEKYNSDLEFIYNTGK